jgi:TolA-binding protein
MKLNNYLLTINITILLAFVFVFQTTYRLEQVKWLIITSFIFFVVSIIGLIWFRHRYPKRQELLEQLREETVSRTSENLSKVMKDLLKPFTRMSVRLESMEKLAKVKTKEDYKKYQQGIEDEIKKLKSQLDKESSEQVNAYGTPEATTAVDIVIHSFLENIQHESKNGFTKAFKLPLSEKNAKLKNVFDQLSFKFRLHVFTSGCVILIMAMIIQMLTNPVSH